MPAVFRRALAQEGATRLVVTLLDQCLAAYPPAQWALLEAQLAALPAFGRPVKSLTRLLMSRASDCELDVQGRILLPSGLRVAAGLGGAVVVVGVLNRIELWAPEAWELFLRESERILDDVNLEVQWPLPASTPMPGGSGRSPSRRARPQRKPNG